MRRAVRTRERVLKAREVELAQAISGHEAVLAELKRARHLGRALDFGQRQAIKRDDMLAEQHAQEIRTKPGEPFRGSHRTFGESAAGLRIMTDVDRVVRRIQHQLMHTDHIAFAE